MTAQAPAYKATRLSAKQSTAWHLLEASPTVSEVLYGGAAGGGKSYLGCLWQIYRRCRYPRTRGLIGRAYLSNLRLTTIKTFHEIWENYGRHNPAGVTYRMNWQTKTIEFSNGSEIILKDLMYYPRDPEFTSLGSMEITDAFIDEGTEITEKAFQIVKSRIRYRLTDLAVPVPKILITGNPSHNWVKFRFVMTRENKQVELLPFQRFVSARLDDNPDAAFRDLYRANLKQLSNYDQQRLLIGDWGASLEKGGEFYHAFDLLTHAGDVAYEPALPIHVSFDQNVVPYITATIWQVHTEVAGLRLVAVDEFCLPHPRNNTGELCRAIMGRYGSHKGGMYYYGDASGHHRDTRGRDTDYTIIHRELRPLLNNRSDRTERRNPPVLRRRDFINDILAGRRSTRIAIHEAQCPNLINDLLLLKQDANGAKLKEKERDAVTGAQFERLGHASDTMDYFICRILDTEFRRYTGR